MAQQAKYVIHKRNQGRSMPLNLTAWIVVALKAFSAPQYLWGAAAMLIIYFWYLWIMDLIRYEEKEVDLFQKPTTPTNNGINTFQGGTISEISK